MDVKDGTRKIKYGKRTTNFRWTTSELSRKLRNGNEIIPKRLKPASQLSGEGRFVHYSPMGRTAQAAAAFMLSGALVVGLHAPAVAESAPLKELRGLARQAEQTAERMHNASDKLREARKAEKKARIAIAKAIQTGKVAERRRLSMQGPVNNIAAINLRNGNQIGVMTVLMSTTPQEILDQSRSEAAITQTTANLIYQYSSAKRDAIKARQTAEKNRQEALRQAAKARKAQDSLDKERIALRKKIADVKRKFASLPPNLREEWRTVKLPKGFDPQIAFGRNLLGNRALQIAMTRIGSPYVWGATGPNTFDCSGLVYWAYKQLGVILPRSSQAMAAGGLAVPLSDIQPGDLVIYYGDASHVGMYAGNSQIIHAPTFGQTVTLAPLHNAPITTVRRY